jgi:tetratricopeptide (TPR) repeat protein
VATETAAAYLLRAGRQRTDAEPAAAADIFGAALSMASSLAATSPELVAALCAEASKGRAETLRRMDRAEDALDDLVMATALFAEARYCDGEAADLDYARAGALFGLGHRVEGIVAAQDARGHYLAAGNASGAAHAEIAEACMRFDDGDTETARKLFHRLRRTLWKLRDSEALTGVWLNLALCEIGRGDGASARHWLVRAGAVCRARGDSVQLLRTRWIVGKYAARFRAEQGEAAPSLTLASAGTRSPSTRRSARSALPTWPPGR